eukprot:CAMPEP_0171340816 /NCGR_PEP_ID=MMETSP0878-20121228/8810_1 /TAXON_ID=67004 /ORGANISM="Thalassiosira weissflogii, Strain CCMP1336" /LENGTH=431 /DNA_ID=CAMNT_0011842937 /DNA_START=151 /DNA_END=1442 /DNA_ORIENTATION=+
MSSKSDDTGAPYQELLTTLAKINTTITSSLHRSIRHHVNNKEYNASTDGLDFLQVKNGLMISYLVDLTMLLKFRMNQQLRGGGGVKDSETLDNKQLEKEQEECIHRLMEMKAALEKMRPLEKRMRYQIDKLLALSTLGAGTFAATGREEEEEQKEEEKEGSDADEDDDEDDGKMGVNDPLSFKPDLQGMMAMFEDHDEENKRRVEDDDENELNTSLESESDDKEYLTTKANVKLEKDETSSKIYQPPRLQSVPFEDNESKLAKQERQLQKQRDRMQRSELAEVVRAQFTDTPEVEDIRGGAMLGKQKELSRRVGDRDREIGEFEEAHMIRLTMGRKERKERKKVMREEMSNLGAIADLGNVVRGMDDAFGDGEGGRDGGKGGRDTEYQVKGMRKRKVEVLEPQGGKRGGRRSKGASNSFQKALYGGSGSGG